MDPISNLLTAIRNASSKGHEKADVPYSKVKAAIAKVLKDEGYIAGWRMMEENRIPFLRIQIKYTDDKTPVISGIRRVSRPGLRVFEKHNSVKSVDGGMGIAILTTSKGLMTSKKARAQKCGGVRSWQYRIHPLGFFRDQPAGFEAGFCFRRPLTTCERKAREILFRNPPRYQ